MEENKNTENNTENTTINNQNKNHHWQECLGMLIAAFLGGFLAMYFVADQVFDKPHNRGYFPNNRFERQMIKDFEKMYERDQKSFERDIEKFNRDFDKNLNSKLRKDVKKDLDKFKVSENWFKDNKKGINIPKSILNPFELSDMTMDSVKIRTEIDDDEYKVIIGLKEFNGDESKINYNVSSRKLTVFGNSQVKDKNYEQDISFSQDFLLPKNADISKIKKEKDGNNLVIEIPLKI